MKSQAYIKSNKFMLFDLIYFIFIAPVLILSLIKVFPLIEEKLYIYLFANSVILSLIPSFLYFLKTKDSIKKTLYIKKLNFKNTVLIILISFAIQPLIGLISNITSIFFPSVVSNTVLEAAGNNSLLTMIIVIGILPAILEEIVGRGIYLYGFKNNSLLFSCIMSGIFFGIIHFNWEQFFYACFMGAIFAFLVRLTGSILASIIPHFIINSTNVILAYIVKNVTKLKDIGAVSYSILIFDILVYLLYTLISSFILILLFKALINNNIQNLKDELNKSNNRKNVLDKYFIISLILYILYMIIKK